jgi:hypothetical protein
MTGTTSTPVTSPTAPTSYNVAFFAQNTKVFASGIGDLTFNETVINVGSGFNSATGEFICPQAGLYMFAWNIASHGYTCKTNLFKNGSPTGVAAISDAKTSIVDDSSTSFAILRLKRGDRINVHGFGGTTSSRFFAGWRIDEHDS